MRITTRRSGALSKFIEAKKAADHAKRELELAEAELIEALRAAGRKSITLTEGDKVQRATFVQTSKTVIDEDGLRKAVGVKLWNKITDRKVSQPKLQQVISEGEISPEQASGFLSAKLNRPYIKYTEGQKQEGDDDSDEQ